MRRYVAKVASDCMKQYKQLIKAAQTVASSLQQVREGLDHAAEQMATWRGQAAALSDGTQALKSNLPTMRTFAVQASG